MKQLVISFVSAVDCHNVRLNVIPLRMAHHIRTGLLVNSVIMLLEEDKHTICDNTQHPIHV